MRAISSGFKPTAAPICPSKRKVSASSLTWIQNERVALSWLSQRLSAALHTSVLPIPGQRTTYSQTVALPFSPLKNARISSISCSRPKTSPSRGCSLGSLLPANSPGSNLCMRRFGVGIFTSSQISERIRWLPVGNRWLLFQSVSKLGIWLLSPSSGRIGKKRWLLSLEW